MLALKSQLVVSSPSIVNRKRWIHPESNSIAWLHFFEVEMNDAGAVLSALLRAEKDTRAVSVEPLHSRSDQFKVFRF